MPSTISNLLNKVLCNSHATDGWEPSKSRGSKAMPRPDPELANWVNSTYPNHNHREAAQRLQRADNSTRPRLSLNNLQLNNVPAKLGQFTTATELDLSANQLKDVPNEVSNLCSLKKLNISNNKIRNFGESIASLKNLVHLSANNNLIASIDPSILKLATLKELDLSHNEIREIPALNSLRNLEHLDISGNPLRAIDPHPDGEEHRLPVGLKTLNLASTQLEDIHVSDALPEHVGDLRKLTSLDVSSNPLLNHLPISFGAFKSLDKSGKSVQSSGREVQLTVKIEGTDVLEHLRKGGRLPAGTGASIVKPPSEPQTNSAVNNVTDWNNRTAHLRGRASTLEQIPNEGQAHWQQPDGHPGMPINEFTRMAPTYGAQIPGMSRELPPDMHRFDALPPQQARGYASAHDYPPAPGRVEIPAHEIFIDRPQPASQYAAQGHYGQQYQGSMENRMPSMSQNYPQQTFANQPQRPPYMQVPMGNPHQAYQAQMPGNAYPPAQLSREEIFGIQPSSVYGGLNDEVLREHTAIGMRKMQLEAVLSKCPQHLSGTAIQNQANEIADDLTKRGRHHGVSNYEINCTIHRQLTTFGRGLFRQQIVDAIAFRNAQHLERPGVDADNLSIAYQARLAERLQLPGPIRDIVNLLKSGGLRQDVFDDILPDLGEVNQVHDEIQQYEMSQDGAEAFDKWLPDQPFWKNHARRIARDLENDLQATFRKAPFGLA